MSQLHCVIGFATQGCYCVLQLKAALVCIILLCFATQVCAGLRNRILRFATQGCAGLPHPVIVFCNSGLRWSASSYCAVQLRVAVVCVIVYCDLQLRVALVCLFLLLCFATQGCAGHAILFCNSGFWVKLVSVIIYCVLQLGVAGLRHLIAFCNSGLFWPAKYLGKEEYCLAVCRTE